MVVLTESRFPEVLQPAALAALPAIQRHGRYQDRNCNSNVLFRKVELLTKQWANLLLMRMCLRFLRGVVRLENSRLTSFCETARVSREMGTAIERHAQKRRLCVATSRTAPVRTQRRPRRCPTVSSAFERASCRLDCRGTNARPSETKRGLAAAAWARRCSTFRGQESEAGRPSRAARPSPKLWPMLPAAVAVEKVTFASLLGARGPKFAGSEPRRQRCRMDRNR
jgi:hypothetical protein